MTTIQSQLDKIKARLERASAQPWVAQSTSDKSKFSKEWREIFDASGRSITQATDYQKSFTDVMGEREEVTVSGVHIKESDATLIAHAPDDLRRLCKALELAEAAFQKIADPGPHSLVKQHNVDAEQALAAMSAMMKGEA